MAPKLEQVLKMQAFLSKDNMLNLGSIKGGPHRYVSPVVSGFIEGADFKAEATAGGADWLLLDHSTGVCQLDVRAQGRTAEGENICTSLSSLSAMRRSPLHSQTESIDRSFAYRWHTHTTLVSWQPVLALVANATTKIFRRYPEDGRRSAEGPGMEPWSQDYQIIGSLFLLHATI